MAFSRPLRTMEWVDTLTLDRRTICQIGEIGENLKIDFQSLLAIKSGDALNANRYSWLRR